MPSNASLSSAACGNTVFMFIVHGSTVPKWNCFDYGGQLVAHHTVLTLTFYPLCAAE